MNTTNHGTSRLQMFHELAFRSTPLVVLESMIYGGISTLALFGNLLVLCVVYKNPRSRNSNSWLVTSLAISDVAMASLCVPPSLAALISGRWNSGFVVCQLQGYFTMWLACASLETMALMSLDRYYRVVYPMKHRTFFTTKRVKCLIVAVWCVACTAPLPYVAFGNVYVFHPGKIFCSHELSISSYAIYVHVVISMVVLAFCYLKVFQGLKANSARVKSTQQLPENISRFTSEDLRVTRTLFVTVVGFLLCWTPIIVIDFVGMARGEWSLKRWVFLMYSDLGVLSSCLNPIIYGAMNKTIRSQYKEVFTKKTDKTAEIGNARPVSR